MNKSLAWAAAIILGIGAAYEVWVRLPRRPAGATPPWMDDGDVIGHLVPNDHIRIIITARDDATRVLREASRRIDQMHRSAR